MIGTLKLVGLYVQSDEERDIEGRRWRIPGFVVEVIEVDGRDKPERGAGATPPSESQASGGGRAPPPNMNEWHRCRQPQRSQKGEKR